MSSKCKIHLGNYTFIEDKISLVLILAIANQPLVSFASAIGGTRCTWSKPEGNEQTKRLFFHSEEMRLHSFHLMRQF